LECGTIARAARCDECKRNHNRIKEKARPTREQRGYDYAWRKISKALREEQPWCSKCGRTNDLTVDHIHPLSDGGQTIASNLQVLCRKCNSSKADQ
jgi:5-methylcytosine-specific restriction endonuclease McrA